ncbi:MAG: hypothetical protein QOD12_3182 [Verrucomicrobiota bacterium]
MAPTQSISEALLRGLTDVFRKLHARSSSGVLVVHPAATVREEQIANAAKEAGVKYRTAEGGAWCEAAESAIEGLTSSSIELVETSDVLMLISRASSAHASLAERDLVSYAQGIGRPVIRIDGETGALQDKIPERIEREQGWLPELFETAGLSPDADLETIKSKMSAVANQAAPLTRRWWKSILLLQALAVLVPLAWLRRPANVSVAGIAVMTFCAVVFLVAVNWWLRWRGMQKTWARARLVAEMARSLLATAGCPRMPALQTLTAVPALRSLRWVAPRPAGRVPFKDWRDSYVLKRVDDQEKYFATKQKEAEKQRKQLTRWATLLLDIGLAFATAGVVLSLTSLGRIWLEIIGDLRFQIVLGITGTLVPVGLLLVQILRGVQELNRRTARFAHQRQILREARVRLKNLLSPEPAMEVIEETERHLLAEVLEWYFHAETAEHFFHIRESRSRTHPAKLTISPSRLSGLWQAVLARTGFAGLFLLRVILGRLPWIVGSGVAILAWIIYNQPSTDARRNQLGPLAHLRNRTLGDWRPREEGTNNGCVILVHGLYGKLLLPDPKDLKKSIEDQDDQSKKWMKRCADAIAEKLPGHPPSICLVDWHEAAEPSSFYHTGFGDQNLLADIPAIRPQAQEVGDQLAFRIAKLINENVIHKDQPLHLIGHSAGGFVVARVAITLAALGLAPDQHHLHVTILDTPGPDEELLFELPKVCETDFYITSSMGGMVPITNLKEMVSSWKLWKRADFSTSSVHKVERPAPADKTGWRAHQWAYDWFIQTIKDPGSDPTEGFNNSPLVKAMPPTTH